MNEVCRSGRHPLTSFWGDGEALYWDVYADGKRAAQLEPDIATGTYATDIVVVGITT